MNEEYENPMDSLDDDSKDVEQELKERELDEEEAEEPMYSLPKESSHPEEVPFNERWDYNKEMNVYTKNPVYCTNRFNECDEDRCNCHEVQVDPTDLDHVNGKDDGEELKRTNF